MSPVESRPNTYLGLSPACRSFFCHFALTVTLQGRSSLLPLPSFREIVLSHDRSVCPIIPLQASGNQIQTQPSQKKPRPREQDAPLWAKREVGLSSCRWQSLPLSGKIKPCCQLLLPVPRTSRENQGLVTWIHCGFWKALYLLLKAN